MALDNELIHGTEFLFRFFGGVEFLFFSSTCIPCGSTVRHASRIPVGLKRAAPTAKPDVCLSWLLI